MPTPPDPRTSGSLWPTLAALAAAAASLALMAVRTAFGVSFDEALQVLTSGYEQDALLGIWRVAHGEAAYTDPRRIPFVLSNYNWLFYEAYGRIAGALLAARGLADEWLPTVARLSTLAGAVVGAAIAYGSFAGLYARKTTGIRALCLAFAVIVFLGPLVGFWAISARPDVWSSALEIAAFAAFIALDFRRPRLALATLVALAYLGWSFKQMNAFALAGVAAYLLLSRRWLAFAAVVGAFATLVALTYGLGSPAYVNSLLYLREAVGFSLILGFANLANFAAKTAPLWLPAAAFAVAAVVSPSLRRTLLSDPRVRLGAVSAAIATAIAAAAGTKLGAAENYYFTGAFLLAFTTLAALSRLEAEGQGRQWPGAAIVGGSVIHVLAVAAVLAGLQGRLSVLDEHEVLTERKRCLAALPRPAFVDDTYLSLPWMNPASPPFVLSFRYARERGLGIPFEEGGIGGLIAQGYFAAVVLNAPVQVFDGTPLDGYQLAPAPCAGLYVYLRTSR